MTLENDYFQKFAMLLADENFYRVHFWPVLGPILPKTARKQGFKEFLKIDLVKYSDFFGWR